MRRPSFWLAASLALAVAPRAQASTVLSRTIDIVIDSAGRVVERHALRVRLDAESDRSDWSPYLIPSNENIRVEIEDAAVERADGKIEVLDKKARELVSYHDRDVVHDSQKFRALNFPEAPKGSVLRFSYRVEIKPYFPSDTLLLLSPGVTEKLSVRISGAGPAFRYRLDGGPSTAVITPIPGGLTIEGANLEKRPELEHAPSRASLGPILRYGWGGASRWEDVGDWYLGLLAEVPRAAAVIRQEGDSMKGADDRATIGRLVDHVRAKVRYVAVEVGIGGYRPRAPEEVRTKAWGDCKDKATLLIDLLGAAGVEAFPALILSSNDSRIDTSFPSADQFNHMIVAVPASRMGNTDGLAVADGYYFVDPTQDKGGLQWFGSSIQEQHALVVMRGASRLVRTPRVRNADVRATEVTFKPRPQGGFEGKAVLRYTGDLGDFFSRQAETRRPEEFKGAVESVVKARLPGGEARLDEWKKGAGEVPEMTLLATVGLGGSASARSLVLPSQPFTPPLATLEGREADIVLDVPQATTRWTVELPDGWCVPRIAPVLVDNEVGFFSQKVEAEGRTVRIERRLEVRQAWVAKPQFDKLRELILAEYRANARSIRFECQGTN